MINTITEEKVALAKEMGCVSMSIGIEAGNPKIRESLNRKYSDEKLEKGIGWMHKHGIKVASFNIIGCPFPHSNNSSSLYSSNNFLNQPFLFQD